MRLPISH